MKTTLIIPDCHHPYVDKKAWDLVLKVGHAIKPHTIVIIGDFGDFTSVSSHSKSAEQRMVALCDEISACNEALCEVDKIQAKTKIYVMGNHEDRIDRYIADKCPEMRGLHGTQLSGALGLENRGFSVVPYRTHIYHEGIYYTHDTGCAGLNAHRNALNRYQRSVIIGHTHRMGYEVKRTMCGQTYVGFMAGWLGDASKCAGYMHQAASSVDWALGFGVVYAEQNISHIQPVVIQENYTCVVGGRLFK